MKSAGIMAIAMILLIGCGGGGGFGTGIEDGTGGAEFKITSMELFVIDQDCFDVQPTYMDVYLNCTTPVGDTIDAGEWLFVYTRFDNPNLNTDQYHLEVYHETSGLMFEDHNNITWLGEQEPESVFMYVITTTAGETECGIYYFDLWLQQSNGLTTPIVTRNGDIVGDCVAPAIPISATLAMDPVDRATGILSIDNGVGDTE